MESSLWTEQRASRRTRAQRSGDPGRTHVLVGQDRRVRGLRRTIAGLRDNESHVLVVGESGTGKELTARSLHDASARRAGPFVPVDCGALPRGEAERAFFGGPGEAGRAPEGAFGRARGGTLFLDEVAELPMEAQPLLLRALEEHRFRPSGPRPGRTADPRIIASTQFDLRKRVDAGAFRADLYYRLDVVRLEIPPLRERRSDIAELAQYFLRRHRPSGSDIAGIESAALSALERREWPGNVRELENAIESAVATATRRWLRERDLGLPGAATPAGVDFNGDATLPLSLDAYEKRVLERALVECRGDAAAAARVLRIGRSTLYRKLAKHGLRAGTTGIDRPAADPASSAGTGVGGPPPIR